MHFLVIYFGLCIVFFLLVLILLKTSPIGWEDEHGFHQINKEEKLITFPLKKKAASNHLTINFKLAHNQKPGDSNLDHRITLSL